MEITVEAIVKASRETTWMCWTSPDHISKWNFASRDWQCPSAESDLQAGGKFNYRMEARDGSTGFDFEGTFREVAPPGRLTFTLGEDRPVTVSFVHSDGVTRVTETFTPEDQNPEELQREGWQAILDNFRDYVESLDRN